VRETYQSAEAQGFCFAYLSTERKCVMQLYPAVFMTRIGALTAVVRAGQKQGLDPDTIAKRGKAKPVYRRGQLMGYHAVYPRRGGGFEIVKETFDGVIASH
jgi:hypothetical protein